MKTSKKLLLALLLVVAGSSVSLDAVRLRSGRDTAIAQVQAPVRASREDASKNRFAGSLGSFKTSAKVVVATASLFALRAIFANLTGGY